MSRRGLVILHLDGVSHALLERAVAAGAMPFVAKLLAEEGYQAQPYRCGVPSTTPFAQAGILYGDSSNIPSYRWWDKELGAVIGFGAGGTFELVAERYFKGRRPLTTGGACIAALYRAGADDRFGPAYTEHHEHHPDRRVIVPFLTNPVVVYHWLRHAGSAGVGILARYAGARLARRRASQAYVFADLFHECVVHHLTRFATRQAMAEGLPVIYSCFYTFDEAAHAFGPGDEWARRILRYLDSTVRWVAQARLDNPDVRYELVVLSDHGQVECEPFNANDGRTLGELVAEWLPDQEVTEHRGGRHPASSEPPAGKVAITYSGGLAHVYFTDLPGRLELAEIERRFPSLVARVAGLDRVDCVLVKDGEVGRLLTGEKSFPLGPEAREFLSRLDEPGVLTAQLQRLNSFPNSGDLVVFGRYRDGRQVNFENQVGGHGSAGGEQLHPFLLTKREWGLDASAVRSAEGLYPVLNSLLERLASPGISSSG
ncbi:MAG: alkaline phosphatase family protein [Chloroflexi bacterium]|nr:MAG: alkaline phosphatase family protein [Chloroflexota bacterium]